MKKEGIGNTVNNNNPQAGERGGGGKDFARDLTELMTRREGRITGKIPQYDSLNPGIMCGFLVILSQNPRRGGTPL